MGTATTRVQHRHDGLHFASDLTDAEWAILEPLLPAVSVTGWKWLDTVANGRTHATTRRVISEHFAKEQPSLQRVPAGPFQAVLRPERRITKGGMSSPAPQRAAACQQPDGAARSSFPGHSGEIVSLRPLTIYDAVGKRLAAGGAAA